jgi:hypothetical protein
MVNRIMETYIFPQKVRTETLHWPVSHDFSYGLIKGQDREVGLDIQCVQKMLLTEWDATAPMIVWDQSVRNSLQARNPRWRLPPPRVPEFLSMGDMMLDLVQRHCLEVVDPSLRVFLRHLKHYHMHTPPDPARGWKNTMIQHLKSHQHHAMEHQTYSVFSGKFEAPPDDTRFLSDGFTISLPKKRLFTHLYKLKWARQVGILREQEYPLEWKYELHDIPCLTRGRAQRRNSQPAPGSWGSSDILGPNPLTLQWHYWVIHYPVRRISELDKLSRRRSLSQTHIRNMFRGVPRSSPRSSSPSHRTQKRQVRPCTNCGLLAHTLRKCEAPCGQCGKGTHQAPKCPVQASNRCKCRTFPCHVAVNCTVRCSRRCGNPFPPSHNKHLNAMTCTHRCCMCGVRGHAGRQCTFKRCQCGQQHLTQDCRWKVECPRSGCDRYLCGLHCAGCGMKRAARVEFVGGRCSYCLADELPVRPKADRPEP